MPDVAIMQSFPDLGFLKNVDLIINGSTRSVTIRPAGGVAVPLASRLYYNHWANLPRPNGWTVVLENWRFVDEADLQCIQMISLIGFRVLIGSLPEHECNQAMLTVVKKYIGGRNHVTN